MSVHEVVEVNRNGNDVKDVEEEPLRWGMAEPVLFL
jgi:hypothetical protein